MIKCIMGYKVLSYKDLEPILMQLRSHAMQYPGFVSTENLISEEDSSIVIMISTWETIENWRTWLDSRITQDLLQQAKAVVIGAVRITAHRTMSTIEWR